ncbi:MAG: prepilin peptidase [Thermoplasmata archaeon]|nr:prepilin peptidase [Thermoplasmata archaeon]
MIDEFIIFLAISIAFIAAIIDVKTKEIPNWLTLPAIFIGIILFTLKNYRAWHLFIPLMISFFFIWLLWRSSAFGGGDAKLLMALVALSATVYDITFIPHFLVMLAIVSLAHYFIFGGINAFKQGKGMKFVILLLFSVAVAVAAYVFLSFYYPALAPYIAAIVFAISADISSSFLPCRRREKVSEKLAGEMLAETIYVKNGIVHRKKMETSFIMRILRREKIDGKIIAKPSYMGLSKEEIKEIEKYRNDVLIFISHPFAPVILLSFLLAILTMNI